MSVVATPRGILGRVHLGEIGVLDIVPRVLHVTLRRPDVLMAFGAQPDAAIPFFVSKRLRSAGLHHADRDDLKRGALLETAFRGTRLEWWIDYGERWERELPEQADAVTTISRVLEQDTLAWGLDPRKVLFLPSGADVERIQVRPKEEARARARPPGRRAGVRVRLGRRRAGSGPASPGDRARDGGAAGDPLRLRRATRRGSDGPGRSPGHGTCPAGRGAVVGRGGGRGARPVLRHAVQPRTLADQARRLHGCRPPCRRVRHRRARPRRPRARDRLTRRCRT